MLVVTTLVVNCGDYEAITFLLSPQISRLVQPSQRGSASSRPPIRYNTCKE